MLTLARLRSLRDLIENFDDESPDWPGPNDTALHRGLERAEELATNYRDPAIDAAALFFAFSEDDTISVDYEAPFTFAAEQLDELGYALSESDARSLVVYRDMIAEGFPWDEFATWFLSRIIKTGYQ
jgi:hypothetical protein